MGEEKCAVCHQRPAKHRCIQCHKPVCDECAFKNAYGVFCSRDCAATHQEFRENQAAEKARKQGLIKTLIKLIIIVVLLGIIAVAVAVFCAKQGFLGEEVQNSVIKKETEIQNSVIKKQREIQKKAIEKKEQIEEKLKKSSSPSPEEE
ncbi:MAG: hypothetical protein KGZ25_02425 [Planctomycetes bacterium]|nr:hypothetical protein [Planctomycetota bacterium]